jgi:hypothetical protein
MTINVMILFSSFLGIELITFCLNDIYIYITKVLICWTLTLDLKKDTVLRHKSSRCIFFLKKKHFSGNIFQSPVMCLRNDKQN